MRQNKPVLLKNKLNGEQFICDDIRGDIEIIDGVYYYMVHKPENKRNFLMRKDVLEVVQRVSKPS